MTTTAPLYHIYLIFNMRNKGVEQKLKLQVIGTLGIQHVTLKCRVL